MLRLGDCLLLRSLALQGGDLLLEHRDLLGDCLELLLQSFLGITFTHAHECLLQAARLLHKSGDRLLQRGDL